MGVIGLRRRVGVHCVPVPPRGGYGGIRLALSEQVDLGVDSWFFS